MTWMHLLLLLAQSDRGANPLFDMGRRFRPGGYDFDLGTILLGGAALIAVLAALWFAARHFAARHEPGYCNPGELAEELARRHELTWQEGSLLNRVAAHHRLEHPAVLFVEPALWDSARLDAAFRSDLAALSALRDKLFR